VAARVFADQPRLFGTRDNRSQEFARGLLVLDLQPIRNHARRAKMLREKLHQEVECARHDHHVMTFVEARLHEVSRAGKNVRLDDSIEGFACQTNESVLAHAAIRREEKLVENAKVKGARIKDGLEQMMKKYPIIGDVRGRGLLLGAELVKDRTTKEYASQEAIKFMDECKERGLLLGKGGLYGNVIRVAPPINITDKDVDFILDVMDKSFAAIAKQ
jgi:glutamate-1-semialdehyde aminotransferase